MTAVTDRTASGCQAHWVVTGSAITRKLFAAVVLLSFSGGVVPLAHAAASELKPVHSKQDHSCCPRVHPAFVPPIAVELSAGEPSLP